MNDNKSAFRSNDYEERKIALKKCYEALKDNGVFISFENFAPIFGIFKKRQYYAIPLPLPRKKLPSVRPHRFPTPG